MASSAFSMSAINPFFEQQ